MSPETSEPAPPDFDFFISYRSSDVGWATWIAQQIEQAPEGFKTRVQAWDFGVGSDFLHEMQVGVQYGKRLLCILSPRYFASDYTKAEWLPFSVMT